MVGAGAVQGVPFNRTIVELKHNTFRYCVAQMFAFNRTIVELKPFLSVMPFSAQKSFNRTIVELKQIRLQPSETVNTPF